jgi:hypothetical protein
MSALGRASIAALALVASSRATAHAAHCEALQMSAPADADFQRCLKSRPILVGGLVGSLTLGGDTGFRATVLTQLDLMALAPVYASARARLGTGAFAEVDLVAGFAFKRSYGAGNHTTVTMSNTYNSPTAYGYSYTTTTTAHTDYVVQRDAWLVLAGVRGVNRHIDGPDDSTTWDPWKTYMIGVGDHYANHLGQQTRIELFAIVRDGTWGASARWFNSIVGMEVGWVPYADGTNLTTGMDLGSTSMFYWNFVDVGLFKDLF